MTELKKVSGLHLAEIAEAMSGKIYALTPVTAGDRWTAGAAVTNERGFTPIPTSWCNIEQGPDAYDTIADYLDTINSALGLENSTAIEIIASSMRAA